MDKTDVLGGKSTALFVMTNPQGDHGFDSPGGMVDSFRDDCIASCAMMGSGDPCGCAGKVTYDVGLFLVNMMSRYLKSGGTELSTDLCQSRNDCSDIPAYPAVRAELP
jgi:hypothetical protein